MYDAAKQWSQAAHVSEALLRFQNNQKIPSSSWIMLCCSKTHLRRGLAAEKETEGNERKICFDSNVIYPSATRRFSLTMISSLLLGTVSKCRKMAENAEDDVNLLSAKQLSTLLQELWELRERGSFCDVVVEVQSRRYLAHKAVLSSTSGYFRSLFLGAPCSSMGPFVVDFVSMGTFEQVLGYVYRGDVTVSRADVRPLRRAARKLELRCLVEACEPYVGGDDDEEEDSEDDDHLAFDGGNNAAEENGGSNGREDDPFDVENDFSAVAAADVAPAADCGGWNGEKEDRADEERDAGGLLDDYGGRAASPAHAIKSEPQCDPPAEGHAWPVKAEELGGRADCLYADAGDAAAPPGGEGLDDEDDGRWRCVPPLGLEPEPAAPSSASVSPEKYYRHAGGGPPERVQCGACGEPMDASVSLLREHSCTHLDLERLECRLCGARFAYISEAVEHALAHTGVPVMACAHCGRRFVSERLMGVHASGRCRKNRGPRGGGGRSALPHHPAGASPALADCAERLPCKVCAEPLAQSMSALREHGRLHVDAERHACRVCGLQMTSSGNLVKHSLLHIGILLFCCDSCSKKFLFKNQLERHHKIRCCGGAMGGFGGGAAVGE
ncbi:zinc finger protein 696-like [Lethenteron reissneri]|uniref:zinc finger protein 696-like n=1 Tax=Lethenteron reissneri TaxID=7753 RepID=UPI002AB6D623|nr:zinc finger protein 696-like [Lethenteron reissneri]